MTRMTLLAITIALSAAAQAQQAPGQAGHHVAPISSIEATAALTDGEVRRIDHEASKINIRHGAIANLDMPPMTMVFRVVDLAMLDAVQVGGKVRFAAEKRDGAFAVTRLERAS